VKVAVVIPTLNEIECLTEIMPRIKREWIDEIIFVDANSTDGTVEYIKEHGYMLFLENGRGLRATMLEALEKSQSDAIITFSPDGNCVPELIPSLIEKFKEGYDMVIASRYMKGAKSYDDTIVTTFGNWMFTTLVNLLYKGSYTDIMGIFRIYKKQFVKDLDLDKEVTYTRAEKLFHTSISWEPILSVRAAKRKLKITEIPGDEPKRIGGKAKLRVFKWGAAYLFQVLREAFYWR